MSEGRYEDIVRDMVTGERFFIQPISREKVFVEGCRDRFEVIVEALKKNHTIDEDTYKRMQHVITDVRKSDKRYHQWANNREYVKFHARRIIDAMRDDRSPMNDFNSDGTTRDGWLHIPMMDDWERTDLIMSSLQKAGIIPEWIRRRVVGIKGRGYRLCPMPCRERTIVGNAPDMESLARLFH